MPTTSTALAPLRPFAASVDDVSAKPIYRPADNPLPFTRNPRLAALDVMILTYAARCHAEWLVGLGACPPDVAAIIRNDVEAIERALALGHKSPHVGPRSQPLTECDNPTSPQPVAPCGDVGEPSQTGRGAKVALDDGCERFLPGLFEQEMAAGTVTNSD